MMFRVADERIVNLKRVETIGGKRGTASKDSCSTRVCVVSCRLLGGRECWLV